MERKLIVPVTEPQQAQRCQTPPALHPPPLYCRPDTRLFWSSTMETRLPVQDGLIKTTADLQTLKSTYHTLTGAFLSLRRDSVFICPGPADGLSCSVMGVDGCDHDLVLYHKH